MSHPIQIFLTCAPSNLMSTVLIPQPDILEQTSYRNLTTSFCRLLFSIFSRSARSRSVSCSFERWLASFSSSSLLLLLDTTMLAHIADIQKRSSFLKSTGTMTVSYSFSKLRKMFWPMLSSPELRQSYKEINPFLFNMYILMKRDMRDKLFLLCQLCGFLCNYRSSNNWRSRRSKTILCVTLIDFLPLIKRVK